MSLDPSIVADALVNLFGALGALVLAYDLKRSDPRGAVSARLRLALTLVSLLFFSRSAAWLTEAPLLSVMIDVLAALTPLAALIVAEGLMRRHAPRWAKLLILCGSTAAAAASLGPQIESFGSWPLFIVVAGGWALVGGLLWRRDRNSLTSSENRSIDRVVAAMLLLTPLIATDFRSLWPEIPVRLGALGALLLMFLGFGSAGHVRRSRDRALGLAIVLAVAGIFAIGYRISGADAGWDSSVRAGAVGAAGLIFAALVAEVLGARSERLKPADPLLAASTPQDFVDGLQDHPVLGGGRVLEHGHVEHVIHAGFRSLLDAHPVLRRSEAPWGRAATDEGVERALSLLITHDATHVLRLSCDPMRLAVFSLPAIAADPRTETEISAVQRIAELLFSGPARHLDRLPPAMDSA